MACSDCKVVIVTGAGSGIGQATAVEFFKKGYNVVLTGRTKEKLETTVSMFKSEGSNDGDVMSKVLVLECDATKPDDNKITIEQTIEKFGRLDCLINNAGTAKILTFEQTSLEQLDTDYKMFVRAVFDFTQKAIPHLLKTKGNVVTVSSMAALVPAGFLFSYSMMKACVDHFTRALSVEYAARGVRINTVNPSYVRTNILDKHFADKTPEEMRELWDEFGKQQPVDVCQEPVDTAKVILFLASDAASFINGANLPLEGGWRNALADFSNVKSEKSSEC